MSETLIEQLAGVPIVGTDYRPFSISPDGGTVAFEWRNGGDWQMYTVDSRGAAPPRRLFAIDDPCGCPEYSADGRFLYFSRDDKGSECFDFYRYELATGALENLLPDTPAFSPNPDLQISPDGTRIAFSADHGQSYAAALMPAAVCPQGDGVDFLADHYANDWTPQWSPDGAQLAWHADTHGQDAAVFVLDTGSGVLRAIGGDEPLLAWFPRWSPDGSRIAFQGVVDDCYAIGVWDAVSGAVDWAWHDDCDAHHPVWSPDGRSLLFLRDEAAQTSLRHLDLRTRDDARLERRSRQPLPPSFHAGRAPRSSSPSAPRRSPATCSASTSPAAARSELTNGLSADLAGPRVHAR